MNKRRVAAAALLLGLTLLLGIGLGFLASRVQTLFTGRPVYNTTAVVQQVRSLSELVTVQYVIEKVVILEDVKWIAGWGENRVLMVAHGRVKAGLNLADIKPADISISGKTVKIKLPPPQITDAYLDEKQTRVIERTTGLLRMFDKDLEQNARMQAVDDIRRAARTAGILKEAETRAHAQLRNLFTQLGMELEIQ